MNYADNPITDLHDAMAHAEYVGFSDIHYEDRDCTTRWKCPECKHEW